MVDKRVLLEEDTGDLIEVGVTQIQLEVVIVVFGGWDYRKRLIVV